MTTITRILRLSAILFAFALVPSLAFAATDPVSVLDNSFSPASITVNPGDTVVWTNYGSLPHTVVGDNGSFSSAPFNPGANFSYSFSAPGTYAYHDQTYGAAGGSGMSGTVTVAGGTAVPTSYATTVPASGSSSSVSSLQAEAQALLTEISQLQAQLGASSGASGAASAVSGSCPNIGRVLSLGSSGTDVSRLQQFLAESPAVYPQAQVTGYYGSLTQAAVERWQVKYNIVSSGTPATTGFGVVGPRTAAAIALLCSTGSASGTGISAAVSGAPSVGGVLQVPPVSGAAPLTVSVQATVNTVSSCIGAPYVLNFGDGTQSTPISTQSGNCQPVEQTFSHTYQYGGTYTLVLASGTHQTTATVTVSGPLSASQAAASGIPADSLHASINSGPAPLSVVFTGTASSLAAYGCTGTCTDTINFGDGKVGLVSIPSATGAWQSFLVDHTFAAAGTYTVQLESVTGAPDGPPITITVTGAPAAAAPTGGTYGIITITPGGSALPVTASASLSIPACAPYQVNWGDGSSVTAGTGACTSGGTTVTVPHTYTSAGTWNVSLDDGSGNPEGSASVTIQ